MSDDHNPVPDPREVYVRHTDPGHVASASFQYGGEGFHLLGFTTDDGVQRAMVTDGNRVIMPTEDDGGEWVVECQDCPTSFNEKFGYDQKVEWSFKGEGSATRAVEFAERHSSLQGHLFKVFQRTTFTFQLHPDAPKFLGGLESATPGQDDPAQPSEKWNDVLGLGDAGGVA